MSSTLTRFTPALVWLALLAAPVAAQPDEGTARLDERIDLALRDAAATEVVTAFGQILGVELDIDSALTGSVTLEVHRVRAETALNAVCESIGCRWRLEGDPPSRLVVEATEAPPPAPAAQKEPAGLYDESLRLSLKDADAREVLVLVADLLDASLDLDPKVHGRLDLEAEALNLGQVLDRTCAKAGCTWKLRERGSDRVLAIEPR